MGMNFCMHEQSMNHIFLEKEAVMQSHPLCRTCVYQVSSAVLGDWEMGTVILCAKHSQVALSFMVGVLLVGMVTAELLLLFAKLDSCNGMANEIIAKHLLLWLQT